MPLNGAVGSVTLTITGAITGLDGSGFSGISLAGSIARLFATAIGSGAATLTALGQVAAICRRRHAHSVGVDSGRSHLRSQPIRAGKTKFEAGVAGSDRYYSRSDVSGVINSENLKSADRHCQRSFNLLRNRSP